MKTREKVFGKLPDGNAVTQFTLRNENGFCADLINFGATLTRFIAPKRTGPPDDLVLGYDNLAQYIKNPNYLGATVGRFANRIAFGEFERHGKQFILFANNDANHLHGGRIGFSHLLWDAVSFAENDSCGVKFSLFSPDGQENYPGNLKVHVAYRLTDDNHLIISYRATSDRETPINLTNHSYWNLAGAGSKDVYGHLLKLGCSRYLPVDKNMIPTGEQKSVESSEMDFCNEKPIGKDIHLSGGYDHCFCIDGYVPEKPKKLRFAAKVTEPASGRTMEVYTDQPGVQLYTGNFLDGEKGKDKKVYHKHSAFCLETQNFPDAVNQPNFPDPFLRPGEIYETTTKHIFSCCAEEQVV